MQIAVAADDEVAIVVIGIVLVMPYIFDDCNYSTSIFFSDGQAYKGTWQER